MDLKMNYRKRGLLNYKEAEGISDGAMEIAKMILSYKILILYKSILLKMDIHFRI